MMAYYPREVNPRGARLEKDTCEANMLASRESMVRQRTAVINVDRGVDITFHGPGQLFGCPIRNLAKLGGAESAIICVHSKMSSFSRLNPSGYQPKGPRGMPVSGSRAKRSRLSAKKLPQRESHNTASP